MGMFSYLGSLIKTDTGNSSKSFTLVLSAIISFVSGLVMCFILIYDVLTNGYVKTDLESAGIFMLCIGGFMAGSSVSKIFGDKAEQRFGRYERYSYDDEMSETPKSNRGRRRTKKVVEDEDVDMTE